jgi:hypothetical protein
MGWVELNLGDPKRAAMERRPKTLWPLQDLIQSVCVLEPARRVRPHLHGSGHAGWEARTNHD